MQCGFCTPGIAMRAKHLLDNNPNPTRQEIAKSLDVHLCRCTGYEKIEDALHKTIAETTGEEPRWNR